MIGETGISFINIIYEYFTKISASDDRNVILVNKAKTTNSIYIVINDEEVRVSDHGKYRGYDGRRKIYDYNDLADDLLELESVLEIYELQSHSKVVWQLYEKYKEKHKKASERGFKASKTKSRAYESNQSILLGLLLKRDRGLFSKLYDSGCLKKDAEIKKRCHRMFHKVASDMGLKITIRQARQIIELFIKSISGDWRIGEESQFYSILSSDERKAYLWNKLRRVYPKKSEFYIINKLVKHPAVHCGDLFYEYKNKKLKDAKVVGRHIGKSWPQRYYLVKEHEGELYHVPVEEESYSKYSYLSEGCLNAGESIADQPLGHVESGAAKGIIIDFIQSGV